MLKPLCEGVAPPWASASCVISGIDLLAAGPFSSVLSICLSLSLHLSPSVCLSLHFVPRWPGTPSRCEIMVNAPWQSDTTHSPGPAPSAFNLIWSEKWEGGVVVMVKGWRVRWRGGGLGACWRGGQDESSACYSPPNRLTILHSSQIALSPPHI